MDRKLKERLLEESRQPDGVKEEIWNRIEARLNMENNLTQDVKIDSKGRDAFMRKIKITTGVAAAAVAAAVFFTLPAGTAFMEDVKSWFVPEKKVEVEVEGHKEQTDQELHLDEAGSYAIYYDKERYKLVQQDGKDVITTKEPLPEGYPEVSLTIEQYRDEEPAGLAEKAAEALAERYAKVRGITQVNEPVAGYRISAINGNDARSEVEVVYVTDNGGKGSYMLTLKYFLEAAEGHGARFEQMLKEFRVLEQ
ncbi:hypothetical protein KP806_02900 [Paenibacillus sp. N4]|uniref:hypothetical protein n=1 Tax=Paenibacillus vietnamensis TaxID=2590547 RepID=UPI001CD0E61B|nr:hypothetical protein [Paenibacillus vietnamensis]MCA0753977.1 hypothetical protein [Paenibacillus vietnamensis]